MSAGLLVLVLTVFNVGMLCLALARDDRLLVNLHLLAIALAAFWAVSQA